MMCELFFHARETVLTIHTMLVVMAGDGGRCVALLVANCHHNPPGCLSLACWAFGVALIGFVRLRAVQSIVAGLVGEVVARPPRCKRYFRGVSIFLRLNNAPIALNKVRRFGNSQFFCISPRFQNG